jgi:hypothetical protein
VTAEPAPEAADPFLVGGLFPGTTHAGIPRPPFVAGTVEEAAAVPRRLH